MNIMCLLKEFSFCEKKNTLHGERMKDYLLMSVKGEECPYLLLLPKILLEVATKIIMQEKEIKGTWIGKVEVKLICTNDMTILSNSIFLKTIQTNPLQWILIICSFK